MINLESGFAFEADGLAGAQENLDLLQAQFLCFVHVDGQSSACHPLQAHLVLESHLPFRLILYWIRLWFATSNSNVLPSKSLRKREETGVQQVSASQRAKTVRR